MQELSARLQCVADFVRMNGCLCDIGCDHAYLPIALVERGKISSAIAMDVRPGPLEIARDHIAAAGLEGRIQTRLSDGLAALEEGEADSIVLAGMGGMLLWQILSADLPKAHSAKEWILQPQSDISRVRRMLRRTDFAIAQEELVMDRGKLYVVIRAVSKQELSGRPPVEDDILMQALSGPGHEGRTGREDDALAAGSEEAEWEEEIVDRFGPVLLRRRHPLLLDLLQKEEDRLSSLLERLQGQDSPEAAERYRQLYKELAMTRKALGLWQRSQ